MHESETANGYYALNQRVLPHEDDVVVYVVDLNTTT